MPKSLLISALNVKGGGKIPYPETSAKVYGHGAMAHGVYLSIVQCSVPTQQEQNIGKTMHYNSCSI